MFRSRENIAFLCNVCGTKTSCPIEKIDREVQSCKKCSSTVRMRSIAYLLSLSLFNRAMPLTRLPKNKHIVGAGLSDWDGYAKLLEKQFSYTNTFFHQEPFLDIANPSEEAFSKYDFIISSDVFEHVPPPSSSAFLGAFNLLKPGGSLILTVPFTNEEATREHFPDLQEYQVIKFKDEEYVLINRKSDGQFETYKDLVFHGGPGTTLEMRVFCRNDVIHQLEAAGFQEIRVFDEDVLEYGIIHKVNWSLPIVAKKPT